MSKRILVIGGVAGGASAAARCRRLDENAEIIVFEKGPHPSFSNCALPYYLSREIPDSEKLLILTPEDFRTQFKIDMRVQNEVTQILPAEQQVKVRNLETGEEYTEAYDELIIATGANAVLPRAIEGIDGDNVFSLKNVVDVRAIDEFVRSHGKNVAVVGGGFIGLEVMENLKLAGFEVTLIEGLDQVMTPLDYELAQILHKEISDQGVRLVLGDSVAKIREHEVELASGEVIPADAVIMSVGVRPEVSLAQECGIELGELGGIKVDQRYQTSIPHIYAVGDVIDTHNFITMKPTRLALAGPAQRQARACADAIYGRSSNNTGVIGSSALRCFDYNVAVTGLNEKQCQAAGIDYQYSFVIPSDKVGIMPDANPMFFKLLFHYPSGRILGAQAVGKGAADKRIDVIATLIKMGGTLEDLKELELCYAPSYSTAKDVTNIAALVGLNLLYGDYEQVPMTQVRQLVEDGAFILDVREESSYERGHIRGSKNIPLAQLRDRIDEIPRGVPVYLHCRSAQTSYFALRVLRGQGFTNLKNIAGSFLALSFYEYFNDKTTGREPIVTEYNFR
ncbi:MAG: FAD-dependent oxidoreductase [Trueperella sp.]|nr:FAD-dependent oxidoreductase [Trueperella sp.]